MKTFFDYVDQYKVPGMFLLVAILIFLGIFSGRKNNGQLPVDSYNALCLRGGACGNRMGIGPQAGYGVQPGYTPQMGYGPQMGYAQQPGYGGASLAQQQNCFLAPASPGYPMMQPNLQTQQVAFQSNSLTLPIGVTLAGRGEVISIEPGSAAQRAGLQIGDRINRINGA